MSDTDILVWYEGLEDVTVGTDKPEQAIVAYVRDLLVKQTEPLKDTLSEVRDLIDGYVDVEDGDYGVPKANKAMRAVQLIDGVL